MTKPISRLNLAKPSNLEMTKSEKNNRHERRKYLSIADSLKIRDFQARF